MIRAMGAVRERQIRALLHLAAFVVALMAVMTLPVSLDASNAPILDGDVLTVIESRDVTEVMSEPGTYFLHAHVGAWNRCSTCEPTNLPSHTPAVATADDQVQRAAMLPTAISLHASARPLVLDRSQQIAAWLAGAPASPPPRFGS